MSVPAAKDDTGAMFVYYFVLLPGTRFEEVEEHLLGVLGDGLPGLADVAYRQGEELRARIGLAGGKIAKTVRLDAGDVVRGPGETVIRLTWEATGPGALFPRMDADLVLAGLGPDLTHLAVRGSYRPPLGPLGAMVDRAILHRVAETCVKDFLDRLAAALADRVAVAARG